MKINWNVKQKHKTCEAKDQLVHNYVCVCVYGERKWADVANRLAWKRTNNWWSPIPHKQQSEGVYQVLWWNKKKNNLKKKK